MKEIIEAKLKELVKKVTVEQYDPNLLQQIDVLTRLLSIIK